MYFRIFHIYGEFSIHSSYSGLIALLYSIFINWPAKYFSFSKWYGFRDGFVYPQNQFIYLQGWQKFIGIKYNCFLCDSLQRFKGIAGNRMSKSNEYSKENENCSVFEARWSFKILERVRRFGFYTKYLAKWPRQNIQSLDKNKTWLIKR